MDYDPKNTWPIIRLAMEIEESNTTHSTAIIRALLFSSVLIAKNSGINHQGLSVLLMKIWKEVSKNLNDTTNIIPEA
ncbi:MAG: hypothetical protein CMO80_21820 [Verrucomicrobiales bacterium]|nr:hypothetical protein [Verrucomicrobiales bacterium]|tara:strand:- start:3928 stop:4158 length:231 start_codon:yes stop_codon:yes gene_type:complete